MHSSVISSIPASSRQDEQFKDVARTTQDDWSSATLQEESGRDRVGLDASSRKGVSFSRGGVSKGELLIFTSQMAIMCKSGVDLAEALQEATRSCTHPKLQPILMQVHQDVSSGRSVSESMRPYEHVFGGAYLGSIAAAESSGKVPEVLDRLATLLRNQIRLRSSLIATISYPAALVGISSLVILALVFFVLPQFGVVFANMNKTPPPLTGVLLTVAAFAREHVVWLAGGGALMGAIGLHYCRQPAARRLWDNAVLNASITRQAFRALFAGRTFRLLGTMLESGVPLLESVRMCRATIHNTLFQQLFSDMERDIVNGVGMTRSVVSAKFLPHGVGQMVATAERTGRLGQVLEMAGDFYEEDGERQIRQLVKLLEPLIIVVMGGIVAAVVASVMLPLLDVTTMSR